MAISKGCVSAAVEPVLLGRALEQSKVVQAKAEACADDIASANAFLKQRIAQGSTTVSARKTLSAGARVKSTVLECAEDLHVVNDALTDGIDILKQTRDALADSQAALADSEAQLSSAREGEQEARHLAMHDATTGLPNRSLFDDRLTHAISLADRHGWTLAVMFLDLDGFKQVNDTHGHAAGDTVLQQVAARLSSQCRHEDSVCRNGGDEFLYLLMNPQGVDNVGRIAEDVSRHLARPIAIDQGHVVVVPSIGISVYPSDGATGEELIGNADAAMYGAKNSSGGHRFFDRSTMRHAAA